MYKRQEELCARVRALSRRQEPLQSPHLSFGDLSLSPHTAALSGPGGSVSLGPKELALLEQLLRAGGRIVSKEQLTLKIWGFEGEAEYNNVEVYVSFLRKKLAFVESRCEIRAHRGLGYCLEAVSYTHLDVYKRQPEVPQPGPGQNSPRPKAGTVLFSSAVWHNGVLPSGPSVPPAPCPASAPVP